MENAVPGHLEFLKWGMVAYCLFISMPRVTDAQRGADSGALPMCTGWKDCNNGRGFCISNANPTAALGMPVVIADFADGVSSDGRGQYVEQFRQLPFGKMSNAVQSSAGIHLGSPPD